jgi:hypothetical protein
MAEFCETQHFLVTFASGAWLRRARGWWNLGDWRRRGPGASSWQSWKETAAMMQIGEILTDLKTRKANLVTLKKAVTDDKDKNAVLDAVGRLIAKLEPIVTERKRLEKLKSDVQKFGKDVDSSNADQRGLINAFNGLKTSCKAVKDDTKEKDFAGLGKDSEMYVALNLMEKT